MLETPVPSAPQFGPVQAAEAGGSMPPAVKLPARAHLAALAGAGVGALSRVTGRGGGSVVGGHVILALEPKALARFSAGRRVVLVSGTNGKTTTTKLLARALSSAGGEEVITNATGANLSTGLAATLASGRPGATAVLEVDEAWLGLVAGEVEPAAIVLLNLSRDQLDRNNEVRQVAERWRRACGALRPGSVVVANADDPLVVWAAAVAADVRWVGAGLTWTSDACGCPRCGGEVHFGGGPQPASKEQARRRAAPGGWRCASCGFARPDPVIWLADDDLTGRDRDAGHVDQVNLDRIDLPGANLPGANLPDTNLPGANLPDADIRELGAAWAGHAGYAVEASGVVHEVALRLPGRCNQANAVVVLAAATSLGYGASGVLSAMAEVEEVAGRYATVRSGGTTARLLLAKNPAGWAEVFTMLTPPPGPVVVAINARTADGQDPSWLWDVPFERLRGRPVVATGERYLDLAVRLHYAEVEHACDPGLLSAIAASGPGRADVVANYTAFHQVLAATRSTGDDRARRGPREAGPREAGPREVADREADRGGAGKGGLL